MRIGLVCPYPWDVPGGVTEHVRELAETLLELGHEVSVVSPVESRRSRLPAYVVAVGHPIPVPYNGSVARLLFGPAAHVRVRRWLRAGRFDVLHLHSPETLSLSMLTLLSATGPMVVTFHASHPGSRLLAAVRVPLAAQLAKVTGRIAVSAAAMDTVAELGERAVLVPNGVRVARYRGAAPLPGWPGPGGAVGFLGRLDEPRKGLVVVLDAFARLAPERPGLRLLVAGPGRRGPVLDRVPRRLRDRVEVLGRVEDEDKPRVYRSVDVFCAPNLGGESFGIVLLEAMAAGTPVIGSNLAAFRAVLDDGRAGRLVPPGDSAALAGALAQLLDEPARREALAAAASTRVAEYDWPVVAQQVVRVYRTVTGRTDQAVAAAYDPAVGSAEHRPSLKG